MNSQSKRKYKFYHVDVFAEKRFGGNPLVVFPNADSLTDEEMQSISFELNLTETAFVFPPDNPQADHKIRIFTPVQELHFIGHPIIGTHYVLAKSGLIELKSNPTRIYQELHNDILPVDIYLEDGQVGKITMTQKEPRFLAYIDDLELLAHGLCCEIDDLDLDFASPRVVSTGMPCMMVPVKSTDVLGKMGLEVGSLRKVCEQHECEMAYAFTIHDTLRPGSTAHARFFSGHLLFEHPATASAAGALGAFLAANGLGDDSDMSPFIIDQGDFLGRPSRIYVTVQSERDKIARVEVSGYCKHVFEATLSL
jgi:trans-2,3-dihydro-3-hydroxyanthranilate isomerase